MEQQPDLCPPHLSGGGIKVLLEPDLGRTALMEATWKVI